MFGAEGHELYACEKRAVVPIVIVTEHKIRLKYADLEWGISFLEGFPLEVN